MARPVLENVEVFASVDASGFDRLEKAATEVHFAPGTAILREGETGSDFFVIIDGHAAVEARDFADERVSVANVGPGRLFGEGSALTGEPRSATVVATEPLMALRFEMERVAEILAEYPEALEALRRLAVVNAESLVETVNSD
ncbi:MAG: cyclic nucleotide-binding domain-containing protein [Myxococcota bacterium]